MDTGSYTSRAVDNHFAESVRIRGCIEVAVALAVDSEAAVVGRVAVGYESRVDESTIAVGCNAVPVAHIEIDLVRASYADVGAAMAVSVAIEDMMATRTDVGAVCKLDLDAADAVVRSTLSMPCCNEVVWLFWLRNFVLDLFRCLRVSRCSNGHSLPTRQCEGVIVVGTIKCK